MITHISEKESQVTHMLTVCNEALAMVTKERDAQRKVLEQAQLALYNMIEDGDVTDKYQARLAITAIQEQLK